MSEFLTFFFNQGILGVISIGEFLIIVYLYRERIKDIKDNFETLKGVQDDIYKPINKLQETADTIITKTQQTNEILLNVFSKKQK